MSARFRRLVGGFGVGLAGLAVFAAFGLAPAEAATAPVTLTWTNPSPSPVPPARDTTAMAYDAANQTTVLFGGASAGATVDYGDTWTWDGTAWSPQSPASSPSARYGEAMAYDPATGTVVLFGGSGLCLDPSDPSTCGPQYLSDTWTWDGTDWTEQTPTQSPPAVFGASMVYDAASGTIVLFGGEAGPGAEYNQTWTWSGTNWTQLSPTTSPTPRYAAAAAYNAALGEVVLFGGYDELAGQTLDDTWTWNGATWTELSPTTSPPARSFSAMAFDPVLDLDVLYGGGGATADLADTWIFDGSAWTELSSTTAPSARAGDGMAWDPDRDDMVIFGGFGTTDLADTWTGILQEPQPVSFTTPATLGQVSATRPVGTIGGASGNPVIVSASGACRVSGGSVTFVSVGTCTLAAAQAGNNSYLAGAASQELSVVAAPPTTVAPTTTAATTTPVPGTTPPTTTPPTTSAPTTPTTVSAAARASAATAVPLALTGFSSRPFIIVGAALVALGIVLVQLSRRQSAL